MCCKGNVVSMVALVIDLRYMFSARSAGGRSRSRPLHESRAVGPPGGAVVGDTPGNGAHLSARAAHSCIRGPHSWSARSPRTGKLRM